jgi:flagellin-like protein
MKNVHRGQSEIVGSILLVAVVVLAITLLGISMVNLIDTEDRQLTDISATATTVSVTISHAGGEQIAAADLAAVIRFDGRSEQYNAADTGVTGPFITGDQWVLDSGLPYNETDNGEHLTVTVIARNTGEVLYSDVVLIV